MREKSGMSGLLYVVRKWCAKVVGARPAPAFRGIIGQLTATIHYAGDDDALVKSLLLSAIQRSGRIIFNGFPTGVEVCPSMHHGGPYPATSDTRFTSVGTAAMLRFARPICLQNSPETLLPEELRSGNPRHIMRLVNNELTRKALP